MLRSGRCHIVEYGVPMAFRLFSTAVEGGSEGLCISTKHPENVKTEYGVSRSKIIWLSKADAENATSPGDLENLRDKITEFAEKNEKGTILLDGVEYLTTTNSFDLTLDFLHDIWEKIALTEAKLIIPIAPNAFEEKQLALLERYSEVMEAVE